MNRIALIAALLLVPVPRVVGLELSPRMVDRAAIERVYHEHRTGTKQAFEQAMPEALLEKLVHDDARKEAVLARVYDTTITPEMLAAEVARIDSTSRAPEMLAEIKAALGDDPKRFADAFAKPILVERALRQRFDNDDALHAPQREIAEASRGRLLALKGGDPEPRLAALGECQGGELQAQVKWTLTPRPAEDRAAEPATAPVPSEAKSSSDAYTNEATAQVAQALSPPHSGRQGESADQPFYFEDLPGELQNVLRAQLRGPGDVSAVIEMPGAFQVFLARELTADSLSAAVLTIPKRSYEEWLAQQPEP